MVQFQIPRIKLAAKFTRITTNLSSFVHDAAIQKEKAFASVALIPVVIASFPPT